MTYEIHLALEQMLPPVCVGDITLDGEVDVADLLGLLSAWGPCAEGVACVQDFDDDAEVGVPELLAVLAAWGACP